NTNTDGPDNAVLKIQLRGDKMHGIGANDGLTITGGGTEIRGLIISNFLGHAIAISGPGRNHIAGCFLGTNSDGSAGANTFKSADVYINNSAGNLVGGRASPDRNLLDDAKWGVQIKGPAAAGNCVWGNFIGVAA